jgi:hypothetical protein
VATQIGARGSSINLFEITGNPRRVDLREIAAIPRHGGQLNRNDMTLTELIAQQSQEAQAEQALAIREALKRNKEIQEIHKRRALYGDRNPTGLLTQRQQRKLMKPPSRLRRAWLKVTTAVQDKRRLLMQDANALLAILGLAAAFGLFVKAINRGKQWPFGK